MDCSAMMPPRTSEQKRTLFACVRWCVSSERTNEHEHPPLGGVLFASVEHLARSIRGQPPTSSTYGSLRGDTFEARLPSGIFCSRRLEILAPPCACPQEADYGSV